MLVLVFNISIVGSKPEALLDLPEKMTVAYSDWLDD
jgi:hypothetical protein